MKKLLNFFFHYSPKDQFLMLKAAILLGVIVTGLTLLPFKVVLATVNGVKPRNNEQGNSKRIPENRINWAVTKVSRYIPKAKCLAKAFAVKVMYAREGYPAELCVGVDKIDGKQIKAHAWVKSQGEIVIGNIRNLARYKELPSLERKDNL